MVLSGDSISQQDKEKLLDKLASREKSHGAQEIEELLK